MKRFCIVFAVLMLLFKSCSTAYARETVIVEGVPFVYEDGKIYGRVAPYVPDDECSSGHHIEVYGMKILRYGDNAEDLGFIFDGWWWLPTCSWSLVPLTSTSEECSTPVVNETAITHPAPVKRCPYCNHIKKKKRKKSHYKWCIRYPVFL